MSGANRRDKAALGRLGLSLLVLAALALAILTMGFGANLERLRERAYPMPSTTCQKTRDCDERSLQIAAREAVTADASFKVSLMQLALGVLGIGGVGFTLYYAHRAFVEAQRSADAAHQTIEETREIAHKQLRAYVHADAAEFMGLSQGEPVIKLTVVNTGQTPAPFFEVSSHLDVMPLTGGEEMRDVEICRSQRFLQWRGLGAGRELTAACGAINDKNLDLSLLSKPGPVKFFLVLRGIVRYGDVNGQLYESEFAFFTSGLAAKTKMPEVPGRMVLYRHIGERQQGKPI